MTLNGFISLDDVIEQLTAIRDKLPSGGANVPVLGAPDAGNRRVDVRVVESKAVVNSPSRQAKYGIEYTEVFGAGAGDIVVIIQ